MSVQPTGADHDLHDELLIARLAGDDLAPSERPEAESLVETCAECALLLADLRSIISDTAALPAPSRARDFRLTPADAARLRPRGVTGRIPLLRSRTTSARHGFASALGAAMATLGLAGMLVSGAISVLPQSTPTVLLGAGGAAAPSAAESQAAAASIARPEPSPGVEATAPQVVSVPAASPASGATTAGPSASAAMLPVQSNVPTRGPAASASAAASGGDTGAGGGTRDYAASPGALAAAGSSTEGKAVPAAASPTEPAQQPLPIVPLASLALLVIGLGLLVFARFAGQRRPI